MKGLKNIRLIPAIPVCMVLCAAGCSVQGTLQKAVETGYAVSASPAEEPHQDPEISAGISGRHTVGSGINEMFPEEKYRNTAEHTENGPLILDAVMDDGSGKMIATDYLKPIVVTARFDHVAERGGKVNLSFDIGVPGALTGKSLQLRLVPNLILAGDTIALEPVYLTGNGYRKKQLRGYELYEQFISRIIPDSAGYLRTFTYRKLLENFISRNIPALDSLRYSDRLVTHADTAGLFGITCEKAILHYSRLLKIRRNEKRKNRREEMYSRYIPSPVSPDGVRCDTTVSGTEDISLRYSECINAVPGLRKVQIFITGSVYRDGESVFDLPPGEMLTFYISSLSTLADNSTRYVRKVIERKVIANTAAYIDFNAGSWSIDTSLHHNAAELERIGRNITDILENMKFVTDSLIITASCSPEGTFRSNAVLAEKRAASIRKHFDRKVREYLEKVPEFSLGNPEDISDSGRESRTQNGKQKDYRIGTRCIPEGWEQLRNMIANDSSIQDKTEILECLNEKDPDLRELKLRSFSAYPEIRRKLYPMVRCVRFDFHLHRRGMQKDTIHTTETDTVYMNGIEALQNLDYARALTLLRPYEDYNTAIALTCLGRNRSALSILEKLPQSAASEYMTALIQSRLGFRKEALEHLEKAIGLDPSMRHRGRLDPEISGLTETLMYDNGN